MYYSFRQVDNRSFGVVSEDLHPGWSGNTSTAAPPASTEPAYHCPGNEGAAAIRTHESRQLPDDAGRGVVRGRADAAPSYSASLSERRFSLPYATNRSRWRVS